MSESEAFRPRTISQFEPSINSFNSSSKREKTNQNSYSLLETTNEPPTAELNDTILMNVEDDNGRKSTKDGNTETFDNPIANSTVLPSRSNNKPEFVRITYVPGLSEELARKLKTVTPNLKIAFRTT